MHGLVHFIKSNSRWLGGGVLLTVFSSFGQTFFISQFNQPLRETFNLTDGQFGLLYMGATLASAATLVFLGKVLDKFPISNIAACVIVCLAVACVGMSLVSSVAMLAVVIYALRLFGQGMMTHTSQTAIGKWYSHDRGRAISLTSTGHQIGEAILPTAVITLIAVYGWRQTWFLAAIGLMTVALPAIFLLMRVERTPRFAKDETPYGGTGNDKSVLVDSKSEEDQSVRNWTRSEVLKDKTFWALLFGVLAPAFIGTAVFFQQDHILEIKGWKRELFAASYMFLAASTVVFMLAGGWLVDKFSSRILLPTFLLPMGLGCFLLGGSTGEWAIFAFMGLLGWSYGFSSALFGTLWPETYGTANLGSIRAVASAAMVFASALGPGVTGIGIDNRIGFEFQLIAMGIYCAVISVAMALVAVRLTKRAQALK